MPVGVHRLHPVQAGGQADGSGYAVELILLRDVATFLEERVPLERRIRLLGVRIGALSPVIAGAAASRNVAAPSLFD